MCENGIVFVGKMGYAVNNLFFRKVKSDLCTKLKLW